MKETVELICMECDKVYLFEHEVGTRDLIGSHYCHECFDMLMGRYRKRK